MKYSQGEYIAFLDYDDIWLPEKLEKQIKVFQVSNEIPMLCTKFIIIEDNLISNKIIPKKGKYKKEYL